MKQLLLICGILLILAIPASAERKADCTTDPALCETQITTLMQELEAKGHELDACAERELRAIQRFHGPGSARARARDMHIILHRSPCVN